MRGNYVSIEQGSQKQVARSYCAGRTPRNRKGWKDAYWPAHDCREHKQQAPDEPLPSIRNVWPVQNPGLCTANLSSFMYCTNILVTTTFLNIGTVYRQQNVLVRGFFFHLYTFPSCLQSLRPRFTQVRAARMLALT